MARLNILAEGQSEERAVRQVISPYLGRLGVFAVARCVETSRTATRHRRQGTVPGRIHRGGLLDYGRARRDLIRWMLEDQSRECFFTTMFDLYRLPDDFPGFTEARAEPDPYQRVARLETALAADLADPRLIPYIQLHEFEALVLADPQQLDWAFVEAHHQVAIGRLVALAESYESPELIDDGAETCPSRRIIREIPAYEDARPRRVRW